MTHRAGPAAHEISLPNMASLKDAQRCHQLLLKEPTAPSVISKSGQCFDHWNVTATGAICAFHPPNRTNDRSGNPVAVLNFG